MPPTSHILILSLTLAGWAVADLPKKAPITKYYSLHANSPFTSKPPPPTEGPTFNPLEDYALTGVSPVSGGYVVTLLNKKKPDERISVKSDEVKPKHGFKILEVNRVPGNPLGTTVRLSSGSSIGTVVFDEKLLTLAAAPAPASKANPQAHPGAQPPQPNQPAPAPLQIRQPRPRVVPAGTPQANPKAPVLPKMPANGYRPPGSSAPLNTRTDQRTHR